MTAPPADSAGRRPTQPSDARVGASGVAALLQAAAEEAARLLGADGAIVYLLDQETGRLHFTHTAGISGLGDDHWIRTLELELGVGLFGRAVADHQVVVTRDYAADGSFVHAPATDQFAAETGIRSMVVAPMVAGTEVFGALGVFAGAADAFTAPQIALVRALADHAALAMANARLIDELARSQEALARQAVIERSLRELGTRISGAREPESVVQHTIDEALRLLDGAGARIDIVDPQVRLLRGLYSAGDEQILESEWPRDPEDRLEVGASGRAVITGETYISRDYLTDEGLVHGTGPDTYARSKGIRGVIATPLFGDEGPFGAITVWSTEPDAFGPEDAALLETIAGQSAVALGRARLIEELGRSQGALSRRAEEERTLREIGSRLGKLGDDPGDVLLRIVHETARLLGGERARLDLLEPLSGSWLWTYPAGTPFNDRIIAEELSGDGPDAPPTGLAGMAVREGRPIASDDYLRDTRFRHYPEGDRGVLDVELHSVIAAPIVGEQGLLGVLQAGHRAVGAFGDDALRLIGALAGQAAIAITNARLVDRLASSQAALERTAANERSLREIAARITSVRDPETILELIVDEARRILGSDGAHLTRLSEDGTYVWPVVIAGGMDEDTRAWLRTQQFPIDGGINGLAAGQGTVTWTEAYDSDPRIPHDEDDDGVAARMGLGAMAAAPLRAPGGEVIGTLAVSYREAGPIADDQLATLQALADHAAIAVSNSDLLARLEASEERYRGLVQSSPDLIFEMDGTGVYTFYSDRTEEVIGWAPDEMIGRHFTEFIDMASFPQAAQRIADLAANPGRPSTDRLLIRHRNGRLVPFEVSVVGQVDDAGRLQAIRGVARGIGERERLERQLRASEERYRFLVENAPDIVFSASADTTFIFISDTVERLTGFRPDELIGETFEKLITPETLQVAVDRWGAVAADPSLHSVLRLDLKRKDGGRIPVEIHSVGQVDGQGRFAGVHGSARDIGERERLERELRESEERYRSVIQSSPDLIWATNRSGRYEFVSDRVRDLLGWEPEDVLGRPFRELMDEQSVEMTDENWARLATEPGVTQTHRIDLRHRDGSLRPFEVSAVAVVRDGEVENVYGIARDISEREHLERDLRNSEERYRYLVQSSPDLVWMTDADGRFTFVSDQVYSILRWAPGELIGRSFADLAPTAERRGAQARFRWLQRRPTEPHRSRLRVRARGGRVLAMEITGIGMVSADGRFMGAHGAARDVSERERLEEGLRRQAAELASSEERSHLARELHDSVTQALFSMTLLARTIELLLDRDPEQAREKLVSLRDLQREALAEMRALIFELRPGNVEEHGLVGALRTHSASLAGRIGLPVVVEADLPVRPTLDVEETMYRIAQEALHNVVKHAGARAVEVRVAAAGDDVALRVTDDGRGFDPDAVPDGHLGLAGMRSRAERLGGRLEVVSAPGQGTTIEVTIPMDAVGQRTIAAPADEPAEEAESRDPSAPQDVFRPDA